MALQGDLLQLFSMSAYNHPWFHVFHKLILNCFYCFYGEDEAILEFGLIAGLNLGDLGGWKIQHRFAYHELQSNCSQPWKPLGGVGDCQMLF